MTAKPVPPATDGTLRLQAAAPKVQIAAVAVKAGAAQAPTSRIVGAATDLPSGEVVKKQDFIDRAIAQSDLKKKDAKPAIEAALALLAEILSAGGEVVLPPLGKLKAIKVKDLPDGAQIMTLKLRTMKDGAGADATAGAGPTGGQGGKASQKTGAKPGAGAGRNPGQKRNQNADAARGKGQRQNHHSGVADDVDDS